jgi:hypothetical protein
MDISTREQWMTIVEETIAAQPRVARELLAMNQGLGAITADWDQKFLDSRYQSQTLEHFEPMVLRVFAEAKSL